MGDLIGLGPSKSLAQREGLIRQAAEKGRALDVALTVKKLKEFCSKKRSKVLTNPVFLSKKSALAVTNFFVLHRSVALKAKHNELASSQEVSKGKK